MEYRPLTREEMRNVIEGKGNAYRIPITFDFWRGAVDFDYSKYPCDFGGFYLEMPSVFEGKEEDPNFRWINLDHIDRSESAAIDSQGCLDWKDIDEVIEKFPSPDSPLIYKYANNYPTEKYRLANWWYCLFERHWSLRGMENALCDFYESPDEVHKLYRALTDFYKAVIKKVGEEYHCDGIFTSDDIGTQTSPFFSLEIFREFFKPYYKEMIDTAHEYGMHFWLHTCGNIEAYMEDFIEIGLDIIHPIQKYTMDEKVIAEKYGDRICIWAGFDVQRNIPYGTAEDCIAETKYLIDTYARPEGRLILTFGNSLTTDTPIDSLNAVLDTSLSYGVQKVNELKSK